MPDRRYPPDDPREWLNRARSGLAKATGLADIPQVYLEDLCFDAQQAAEKAIKAVLLSLGLPSGYAVQTRYPGLSEPVSDDEYREAVKIATAVLRWAEEIVRNRTG